MAVTVAVAETTVEFTGFLRTILAENTVRATGFIPCSTAVGISSGHMTTSL